MSEQHPSKMSNKFSKEITTSKQVALSKLDAHAAMYRRRTLDLDRSLRDRAASRIHAHLLHQPH